MPKKSKKFDIGKIATAISIATAMFTLLYFIIELKVTLKQRETTIVKLDAELTKIKEKLDDLDKIEIHIQAIKLKIDDNIIPRLNNLSTENQPKITEIDFISKIDTSFNRYDIYALNGFGVSGMYRPYRTDVGVIYDKSWLPERVYDSLWLKSRFELTYQRGTLNSGFTISRIRPIIFKSSASFPFKKYITYYWIDTNGNMRQDTVYSIRY